MNNLKPLQTQQIDEEQFKQLLNKTEHTELELGEIHHFCLQLIKRSRKDIVMEMIRAGWLYTIIQNLQTWKIDGSEAPDFDAWLHDPDHTFGMSHKWAWESIRIYEFSNWLLNEHNINLADYLDIGWHKLSYVIRAIKKYGTDKTTIIEWLQKGTTYSSSQLEGEVSDNPYVRGFGTLAGHILTIEYAGKEFVDLDGCKVTFAIRKKKK